MFAIDWWFNLFLTGTEKTSLAIVTRKKMEQIEWKKNTFVDISLKGILGIIKTPT